MPEEVFVLLFFITIFSFVTIFIVLGQRHKLKMRRLELEAGIDATEEFREEMDQLQEELAQLKHTIAQQQRAMEQSGIRIDLTPYEREQLRLDQDNKFSF